MRPRDDIADETLIDAPVLLAVDGPTAWVTLNRPQARNAMSGPMLTRFAAIVEVIEKDPAIDLVVVRGAGGSFCVGGDLALGLESVLGEPPRTAQVERLRDFMRISERLHQMPAITVAAVEGGCAGAGLSLALSCDMTVASTTARINTAFLGVGLSGDFGGIWFATQRLGARARQLFLRPRVLTAADAERYGLIDDLAPAEADFEHYLLDLVDELSSRPRFGLRQMKANLNDAVRSDIVSYCDAEAERHVACIDDADAQRLLAEYSRKSQSSS